MSDMLLQQAEGKQVVGAVDSEWVHVYQAALEQDAKLILDD